MENKQTFSSSFDSLAQSECPEWFRDAKFGIWSHWGPQSVPMCGDWYARNMYIQGTPQYQYHLRHYGHPSKFGYKDICALWKADKFNPEELMGLYVKAGAKYFVAQAMHHDHFFNFPSRFNKFNSTQMGPKKDICGMWKAAADKFGLPFGLTEHLGASFSWWKVNKWCDTYGPYAGVPYDGSDPEYKDFYFENMEHVTDDRYGSDFYPWYTSNKRFQEYWLGVMKEVINLYQPDLLYTDGPLPFGLQDVTGVEDLAFQKGLDAVAYLYNMSVKKYGENHAVYTQKDRRSEIHRIGVLDIEKSQLPGIQLNAWQTDTCIGNWFYDAKQTFKKPGHIVEMLVDIISKNGTMLLNVLQRPDGSIDDETVYILEELASWFSICSEGVYGTRPWRVFGEGDTEVLIEGFKEVETQWNSSDFRFTTKGKNLYAFMLKASEKRVTVIKSLGEQDKVVSVRLLGGERLPFTQAYGILTVKLPQQLPTKYTNCLAIEFD